MVSGWLVIAGAALHMATAAHGMTEPEFFAALRKDVPELTAVHDAAAREDWPAARAAFVAHMKQREHPRWFIDWRARPENPAPAGKPSRDVGVANDALEQRFTSIHITHQFPEEIDWAFNPTTEPDSPHARNHEWTWQFNRHPFWRSLGRAYWETGDERFAKEFVRQMTHWVALNPVPEDKADQSPGSRWRTIEAGIRMGGPWPDSFYLFLSSPSFTDEAIVTMARSMAEHARYLRAFPTRNNWLAMEMCGLYTIGALFPELAEAEEWRKYAAGRSRAELDIQFYPDGAQRELAPGYHWVSVANFLDIYRLAQENAYPLPEGYIEGLEKAFEYSMWIMTPDGGMPPFNDSGWATGSVPGRLQEGFELFPHRRDFQWLATKGAEGVAPAHTSYALPYAGYVMMRSGWERDARYMAFDAGPFGAAHQHEDKLNFVLAAYGRWLVVEGCIYTYDASEWRRYVLGPYAHNVAFVDGDGQNRRGVDAARETPEPLPYVWETNGRYDYVRASYGSELEGFGEAREPLAVHTRRVLFIKDAPPGGFWVIADTFVPNDDESHTYETVFHLDAPSVDLAPETLAIRTQHEDGPNLGIFPLSLPGLKASVISGQTEPFVQGWIADRSASMSGVRPIPTPVYSIEAAGMVHVAYAFLPVSEGTPPEVAVAPLPIEGFSISDGLALSVIPSGGPQYNVVFSADAHKIWHIDGAQFTGEASFSIRL